MSRLATETSRREAGSADRWLMIGAVRGSPRIPATWKATARSPSRRCSDGLHQLKHLQCGRSDVRVVVGEVQQRGDNVIGAAPRMVQSRPLSFPEHCHWSGSSIWPSVGPGSSGSSPQMDSPAGSAIVHGFLRSGALRAERVSDQVVGGRLAASPDGIDHQSRHSPAASSTPRRSSSDSTSMPAPARTSSIYSLSSSRVMVSIW